MTLFDCSVHSFGTVTNVGGDDATRRRLVDMGALGATYLVRAKTKRAILVDVDGISLVVEQPTAAKITVLEKGCHETRALRKSKRRQNNAV